jgi:hypothetical protein
MKSMIKGGVLTTLALIPLVATARTMPASSGRAVAWSDGSCFGMNSSSMQNNCSTLRSFELPLVVDSAGSKTVYVTAYGATPSNNVGCIAVGVNRELTAAWSSSRLWLPAFGSSKVITLTGAYVPAGGLFYTNCHVNPGGRVNVVDYNP